MATSSNGSVGGAAERWQWHLGPTKKSASPKSPVLRGSEIRTDRLSYKCYNVVFFKDSRSQAKCLVDVWCCSYSWKSC